MQYTQHLNVTIIIFPKFQNNGLVCYMHKVLPTKKHKANSSVISNPLK